MTSDEKIAQLAAAVDEETKLVLERRRRIRGPSDQNHLATSSGGRLRPLGQGADAPVHLKEHDLAYVRRLRLLLRALRAPEEELGDVLEQEILHRRLERRTAVPVRAGATARRFRHRRRMSSSTRSWYAGIRTLKRASRRRLRRLGRKSYRGARRAEDTVHTEGLLDSVPQFLPRSCRRRRFQKARCKDGA